MIDVMQFNGLDLTRPFSRARALDAGLSDIDLRRFTKVMHGIYIGPDRRITPVIRAQAALLHFGPTAYASHQTAARLYGLAVPHGPEHVTVPGGTKKHVRTHVVCHETSGGRPGTVRGVPASSPEQLFVELGTELSLVDLVVVGDQMLHHRLTTLDQLRAYVTSTVCPGTRLARRAVAYVRQRAESPMETRSRMLIRLAGLPDPDVNVTINDEFGTRRPDLRYPRSRTTIEYDGAHHRDQRQWEKDLARRQDFESAGDRVIVWTSRNIYTTPEASVHHLHQTLLERGEPDLPRRLRIHWRQHFQERAAG